MIAATDIPPFVYGGAGLTALIVIASLMLRLNTYQGRTLRGLINDSADRIADLEQANDHMTRRQRWCDYRFTELAIAFREDGKRVPAEFLQDTPPPMPWPRIGDAA